MHPAGQHRVAQHDQRGALDIVHVHPAPVALELDVGRNQHAAQAGHALLMQPGGMLLTRLAQHLQLRLGLLRGGKFGEVVGQPVFVRHKKRLAQQVAAQRQVVGFKGLDHGGGGLLRRLVFFSAELARTRQPGLPCRRAGQCLLRKIEGGKFRKKSRKRLNRRIDHAFFVGQQKLGALVQRGLQGLVGLKAAVAAHQRFKIGLERGVRHHGCIKPPPDQRARRAVVFEQLVIHRHFQPVQHRHGRIAQQGGKPAVKGANLHRAAVGEHGAV